MLHSAFKDHSMVYNHNQVKPFSKFNIPPQTHDVYEIILLQSGDVTYSVEERSYRLQPNSMILTRPGKLHSIQVNEHAGYDRYDILFDGAMIRASVLEQIPVDLDVIYFGEDTTVISLFQKMERYCRYFDGEELKKVLVDALEQIIYEVVIFIRQGTLTPADQHTVNPTVAAAIEYIDSHMHIDFSLDMLCKELFVSKSYLHQLFIRYLQVSPWRYIVGKRLLGAQQAIRAGERPTDIYSQFGFKEYSSFYRAYFKQFGYAPSEELNHPSIREIEF